MKVILNQARWDNTVCKSSTLKSKVIHSKFERIKQKVMINLLYANIIGMFYFQSNNAKVVQFYILQKILMSDLMEDNWILLSISALN